MEKLTFDTGIKEFEVNGGEILRFNPTDSAFVERLFRTFDTLDKKQDAYKEEVSSLGNKMEIFDLAYRRDAEMRELIDGAFEAPVCAGVFGDMNVYALADGLPVWCNFLLAIMDTIDTTFAREEKATNPRIAKYTTKYHR